MVVQHDLLLQYGWGRNLRVFEKMILRRIFGPKRDNGKRRRLHNEELHSLFRSPTIFRMDKSRSLAGDVARKEDGRSAFKVLTCKPLERSWRRWEDNIGLDIK